METIEAADFLIKETGKLWDKYKDKAPTPGAPADDYMIIIGQEFYKADDDAVSRAYMVDPGRAKAVINGGVYYVSLAAGGEGQKAAADGKTVELTPLLIDSEFVNDLKKQATTPSMLRLAMSVGRRASWLGNDICNGALAAVEKRKKLNVPAPIVAWTQLATTIRAFNALAQGRPVNIPDIACGLIEYSRLLETFCTRLVEKASAAITTPGDLDYEGIHAYAEMTDFAVQEIAIFLAFCNVPGVTIDGATFEVDCPSRWTGADLSIDEITYLAKKAQSMTPTPAMTELKGKCIKVHDGNLDRYALAKAVAEYFGAVRNSI